MFLLFLNVFPYGINKYHVKEQGTYLLFVSLSEILFIMSMCNWKFKFYRTKILAILVD